MVLHSYITLVDGQVTDFSISATIRGRSGDFSPNIINDGIIVPCEGGYHYINQYIPNQPHYPIRDRLEARESFLALIDSNSEEGLLLDSYLTLTTF